MTNQNTFTGKNVEAAVAKASASVGVDAAELNYEILAGKTGGFALIKVISGKKAEVELVEKLSGDGPSPSGGGDEPRREAREDREPRGDRGGDRDRGDRGGDRDRGGRGDRDRGGRGDRDRGARGERGGERGDRDRAPRSERGDRGGRGDRDGSRRGPRRPERTDELVLVPEDGPVEVSVAAAGGSELGPRGEQTVSLVRGLLEGMSFGMHATVTEDDENIRVDLESGVYHDAFIANDLELLDAFEHLVDKSVNASGDDRKKVMIDSMGIKAKADVDLADSARTLAERALDEGRAFKIGPLDPRSRRIVHLTLREFDGVVTKSEGEGVFRRVCIMPKQNGGGRPQDDEGDNE